MRNRLSLGKCGVTVAVSAVASCSLTTLSAGARSVATIPAAPTVRASVLDQDTDIAVSIASPRVLGRGASFNATVSVANLGKSTAKWISCGVAKPRVDAVSNFRMTVATKASFDQVEGHESKVFAIPMLRPREIRAITLYGTTVVGTSTPDFDISVFCAPRHIDANQSNNAATRTLTLWPEAV